MTLFLFFLVFPVQPNQLISFLFTIIFIIRIRLWIFQTVNLYFLCLISLLIVFITLWNFIFALANRLCWGTVCQHTGEMTIDWAFTLVFDIQWIHCQYLQQIELYLHHQFNESVSNKNLALHWPQNSCPGIGLTFLVFSCWAIWRVITCSPLTLRWCFINTPHVHPLL